jgi:monomeric sarcosine oxidase
VVVVGAGVFGAWTVEHLRRGGGKVLLLDAWGPAHARASSGGESRMTRAAYGKDEIYSAFAAESLAEWVRLSERSELPLFHRIGVLFFFPKVEPYVTDTMAVHRKLGLPTQLLDAQAMRRRFPQFDFSGVEIGLYEPEFGALMARRAVQELVSSYVPTGGLYEQEAVLPPTGSGNRLTSVKTRSGRTIEADQFVFACGPWLPKLFPAVIGNRILPTRQEIFFFQPDPGDRRFDARSFPGWADFNGGDIYYGFPDLEGRGFKIAHDAHGPPMDPDRGDRMPGREALDRVRAFMSRRFPALAGRPLSESRVCQYENSANGDLLIDFHPTFRNVLLVGAGSGHGFKHGPAVGRYAAQLLRGTLDGRQERFSLASKSRSAGREVH